MKYLSNNQEREAVQFMNRAAEIASDAKCLRAKCGTVIVKDGEIIGKGFNSPPLELDSQKKCEADKTEYHRKVSDKTCCIHAEQRAMFDALKNNPDKIKGSTLYFMRIDEQGMTRADNPYCTICSKSALDLGIKEFVLWHEKGICVYNTDEYNLLSFKFKG